MRGALTVRERRERRQGWEFLCKWVSISILAGVLPVMFCFATQAR